MLKLSQVHTFYGFVHALRGIDLEVKEKEIVCLIGSNGAGKTTTVSSISGLVPPKSGSITFRGQEISHMAPYDIVNLGISLCPEGREVFPDLTVEENLQLGAFIVQDRTKVKDAFERVYELFPRLKERRTQSAGTLSGGEQQMLTIGRALMSGPQLLMLDEPSLGLAPNLVIRIFELIKAINQQGTTILLIEQNANMALNISDRAYVMETGHIAMSGPAAQLAKDPKVKAAYLGLT
ncbi:MAG: ABC transporter ATP-binding protein [Limnochordia bacterium]|jgi:branched-chain amino acid transport system ATP-binding protein